MSSRRALRRVNSSRVTRASAQQSPPVAGVGVAVVAFLDAFGPKSCRRRRTARHQLPGRVRARVPVDYLLPDGLVNLGCGVADNGAKACLLDLADPFCWIGAQIFSVCAGATTEDEVIGYYLGCFHDMNGAHTVIPCYIPYADEATLVVDCEAADLACLPDIGAGGAGGEGGAGG